MLYDLQFQHCQKRHITSTGVVSRLRLSLWHFSSTTNGYLSLAQGIHPAFDASTELLRYSHRSTLKLIVGLVDLALDVSLFLEQFFEIFKVWTLCSLPVEDMSAFQRYFCDSPRALQIVFVGFFFSLSSTAQCCIPIILCLAKACLDATTARLDLWRDMISQFTGLCCQQRLTVALWRSTISWIFVVSSICEPS